MTPLIVALLEEKEEKKKARYIFKKGNVIKSTLRRGRKKKSRQTLVFFNEHVVKGNHGCLTDSSLHIAFVVSSCSCRGFPLPLLSSCCHRQNQHLLHHLQEITVLDITPFTNCGSTMTTMMWSLSGPTGFNLHQVTGFALVPMGTVPGPESQAINRWEEVWREFITRHKRKVRVKRV